MKDWDDLRYFLAVARAGSLAGASRALGVNHSTVFRRIGAFEDRLETRLFERLPEGYRLTAAGEHLRDRAEVIQEAMDDIERKVLGRDVRLAGTVRVTAPPNVARDYLAPLLAPLQRHYPDVHVQLVVGDTDLDLARLEADLAVRATPAPPDYLVGRRICALRWHACAGTAYLANHARPVTIDDLAHHPLIGGDLLLDRLAVFRWVRASFPIAITTTCNDLSTMAAMIREGVGIGFLPSDQIDPAVERLFEVVPEVISSLWILTHPDLRYTARIKAVADFLHEQLRDDPRLVVEG